MMCANIDSLGNLIYYERNKVSPNVEPFLLISIKHMQHVYIYNIMCGPEKWGDGKL